MEGGVWHCTFLIAFTPRNNIDSLFFGGGGGGSMCLPIYIKIFYYLPCKYLLIAYNLCVDYDIDVDCSINTNGYGVVNILLFISF